VFAPARSPLSRRSVDQGKERGKKGKKGGEAAAPISLFLDGFRGKEEEWKERRGGREGKKGERKRNCLGLQ